MFNNHELPPDPKARVLAPFSYIISIIYDWSKKINMTFGHLSDQELIAYIKFTIPLP